MHRHLILSAALACGFILQACTTPTPTHVGLAVAARDRITSTEVVAPIGQSEITVFVPPSTIGADNGLMGALIDNGINSHRAGTAERDVRVLRDAMLDYDFDARFRAALQDELSKIDWLNVRTVRVVKDASPENLDRVIQQSVDSAVLIAVTGYNLANDGSVVGIGVTADLFPKTPDLDAFRSAAPNAGRLYAPENAIYRKVLGYEVPASLKVGDRATMISTWSSDGGAALRTALDRGAGILAARLAADLQAMSDPSPRAGAAASTLNDRSKSGGRSRLGSRRN